MLTQTPQNNELVFFTSAEIADILKMHPQVIARKLQAGEIGGYKLGKDWRVSKDQLMRYLEQHSNQNTARTTQEKTVGTFFKDGVLKTIPATRSKRLLVLKHLASKLDSQKVYTEAEMNQFLKAFHSDICTLRRELVVNKLMVRKDGKYKIVGWNQ